MTRLILRFFLFIFTFIIGIFYGNAQQVTGRILDSETYESIPYATIRVGETDLVSNDNGYFTVSGENASDSSLLSITFIGYNPQKISINELKSNNNIIKLVQGSYNIGGIAVSNIKPNPLEVMKLANENLAKNYTNLSYKNTFFSRSTSTFKPSKLDIEIKKSTGISKSDLAKANKDIQMMTQKVMSNQTLEYSDKLFNLYKISNDKSQYKLEMKKAIRLKDENKASNFEEIEKETKNLFLKLLDTTKFYRIKSGLIGSRDTVSFNKKYNEKKNIKSKSNDSVASIVKSTKSEIISDLKDNLLTKGSVLDFVHNYSIYTFTYIETTYLSDNLVYVIDFKPRKGKAKFTGRLYINEEDYAIIRADYKLADGKTLEKLNLKLLLGVKFMENLCTGTIIYKKNSYNNVYHHQYFSQEKGSYFYVNRPLKFIELTDQDKDVVAFNFKIEGQNIEKTEFLNIESKPISESEFNATSENNFSLQTLKKYDSTIWKGYNVIEPLDEMKKFEVIE